ncbi:Bcr/CflA family drug resistance efflux transporter [Pedobacter yulinensis]|uniref:Bcr/CflA family drug resistance efflux transporter n=1 Tax=Pedobacter yulinensis TaxID=2126353 RepID=A0A2T3HLU9_9SPHI|nr:multidrug effflux MFS transporter [Pedobacter yulinensis]PST83404.1 Bcr/CflA family drug resistance efflux transporter [Pedobacter yulinensis]
MKRPGHFVLILILGSLAALSPFSIDMYLPGFDVIARDLKTSVPSVSLSLSGFFIGISAGQLLYGPLLDKFGRKLPLYFGMALYIAASLGCLAVTDIDQLIVLRFVQAIGSCAASVAAMAMVRDLFTVAESPKVFASLMLVIAVSPMLAPTAGGYLIEAFGWQWVFVFLAFMAAAILVAVIFFLPESYQPDRAYSLKPGPILRSMTAVATNPQFFTYCLVNALTFAGLFAYVAASPIVFMTIFGVSKTGYGWIFALLSVAFIGLSQVNSLLLRWFNSNKVIALALPAQALISLAFLAAAAAGWLNLYSTVAFIALYLGCLGLINPNSAALTLAPFNKNAGSASALMGALQMGLGALASVVVSLFPEKSSLPMPLIMAVVAVLAWLILLAGRRLITRQVEAEPGLSTVAH